MSTGLQRWKAIWTSALDMRQAPLRKVRGVLADTRVRQDILYPNLAELAHRYGAAGVGLSVNELRVFSQNGEDGIIAETFRRIGATNQVFIEFGIGAGIQGNCVFLADVLGWSGLFMEADPHLHERLKQKYQDNDMVQTSCTLITAENINHILSGAKLPRSPDLMSIDIDGNDYWIWRAVDVVRPRVVIIEYNGSLDTRSLLVQPYLPNQGWDASDFFGASLEAVVELGRTKGYTLVHTDLTGTNAFFVDTALADSFSDIMPAPRRRANYSLQGVYHTSSPRSDMYVAAPKYPA